MVISSPHPLDYKGSSAPAPGRPGLGEEVTGGRPYLPPRPRGVIWLIMSLMGDTAVRTPCAPQWGLIHISYNGVFKSVRAWRRRLARFVWCLPRGRSPPPSQTGRCSGSRRPQLVKERAGCRFFLPGNRRMGAAAWKAAWSGPLCPAEACIRLCRSNAAQRGGFRGSGRLLLKFAFVSRQSAEHKRKRSQ